MKLAQQAVRAGYRINAFETLGSTSDEALRRAGQGDPGKLWIVAGQQTGGRGRQGRLWTSPPGNVYASLLLVDCVQPAWAAQLGFVAGVALVKAIRAVVDPDLRVAIKWPNDLVHDGAKLAGILVEGARCPNGKFACVMGFGINRQSHPEGMSYPAADLFGLSDLRPSIDDIMMTLSASVHDVLDVWDRGRNFDQIRSLWLKSALPPGTALSVVARAARTSGTFETIDAQGRLVLSTPKGAVTIDAGEVFLMDRPVAHRLNGVI